MDETEDDKKPFDVELGHDDDSQPDPDETLMLDQGGGKCWLVKIPKFLMERWAAIDAEDVHLATVRIFHEALGRNGKAPRIVMFLPPARHSPPSVPPSHSQNSNRPIFPENAGPPALESEPDFYELDMINDAVENHLVVAERPKDHSFNLTGAPMPQRVNTRARTTIVTGRIKHECSLRPVFSRNYRRQMRERHKKYNTPQRQIMMIEDAGIEGGRGGINRLSSGVGMGAGSTFGNLVKTKPKPAKGQFERMARMPRNQLYDLIFQLFRSPTRWGIKPLRERTQQPEAYLKEVLSEVAFLHRSGEHNGLWELRDNFKDQALKGENVPGPSLSDMMNEQKMETMDDEELDDDDEDMEEVS